MAQRATKPDTPAAVADAAAMGSAATIPPPERPPEAEVEEESDARMAPGTVVAERYRISQVLGEGGMGVVYAAEHVLMRKEVALKVLHAEMCSNPEVVARFEREAIAAAHIDHPNVAGATDFGRLPDGSCYLVLELLRGSSLRDEVTKGPIPLDRALRILRGIASGVAAAHAKGIVHRDLKPENVMIVERDGRVDVVKVLDFGIAKLDASAAAAPQADGKVLTRIGTIFGTPEYMAPEQAVGDTVDARADLYALGVMFLEMLTGKCPFSGNAMSILRERVLAVGPPDMSGVADASARALITKLLAQKVDERVQTATDLVAWIGTLIGDTGSTAALPPAAPSGHASGSPTGELPPDVSNPALVPTPSGAPAPSSPPPARPRWQIPAAIALLATVAGAVIVVVVSSSSPSNVVARPAFGGSAPTTDKSLVATPSATVSATAVAPPPASVVPTATVAASTEVPEGAPSGEPSPNVAPTSSAASARATPRTPPGKPPRRPQPPPPKKATGPGGINIQPLKDFINNK